ncbi:MAG: single-stranded DNA-binding protein [Bacteroidales bacterium]|nr:single-stranded DNA-binding protein [Bacteroidales bacterium]
MNKVLLMGRLAKEPEIRQTRSGKSTASWVLAVDKPYKKDRPEGEPTADFIPLVSWDKSADFVGQYLHKGSRVMVEGRMQVRSYEAQDGSKRWITEVVTQNIEFADSKPKDGGYGQQQGGYAQAYNGFGQPTNQGVPY